MQGDVMFEDFEAALVDVGDTNIFVRRGGTGPGLLLLHGFPQTHLMWRHVAPMLARDFSVVCADLRGYGASGKPNSTPDHAPYAKRALSLDMRRLMESLGLPRFSIVGHDRGGRVAYRLALDHPDSVERLALLDVIPTSEAFDRADARFALAFWPWSMLAQPEPLPERLLLAEPEAVVSDALSGWGSDPGTFSPEVRAAYVAALRNPQTIHAICEEYRAAATLDREHDSADLAAGRRLAAPLLVLWAAGGPLDTWYESMGGPLGIWRRWANEVSGHAMAGGHFFAEQNPTETSDELGAFLRGTKRGG
jgi:haloacetate dehalogenase